MPEFVITVARFGFLVLLWTFVLAVVMVIRRDVGGFGRSSRLVATPRVASRVASKVRGVRVPKSLVVTGGALAGTELTLGEMAITIGRAEDSTLVVTDDYVSTRHAKLVPRGNGEWVVEDLGSLNGTYLGNDKVTAPTPVPINTPIRIANTSLELRP